GVHVHRRHRRGGDAVEGTGGAALGGGGGDAQDQGGGGGGQPVVGDGAAVPKRRGGAADRAFGAADDLRPLPAGGAGQRRRGDQRPRRGAGGVSDRGGKEAAVMRHEYDKSSK